MRGGILREALEQQQQQQQTTWLPHAAHNVTSFTAQPDSGAPPDVADASKFNGKKGDKEIQMEKDAVKTGSTSPAPPPQMPDDAEGVKLPAKSTVDERMKKFKSEMAWILNQGAGGDTKRCLPARPIPQRTEGTSVPLFQHPTLPICSRDTKGKCPYYIDRKSGKLERKKDDAAEAEKAAGEGEKGDKAPGEAPKEPEESGLGPAAAWLALLQPTAGLPFKGALGSDCRRCGASGAANTKCCAAQKHRRTCAGSHSCGYIFL